MPNQTKELEQRISEIHQQLKGISPTSAELKYLDKVKWHDMYGVDLHPVLVSSVFVCLPQRFLIALQFRLAFQYMQSSSLCQSDQSIWVGSNQWPEEEEC